MTPQEIQALAAKAAAAKNMNETKAQADFKPLEPGTCMLRFVEYVEIGEQVGSYQGKETVKNKAKVVFEVFGKKWPLSEEGKPPRIYITVTNSQNPKSGIVKLFKSMNYAGDLVHIAQALGRPFVGKLEHNKVGEGDKARTYVNLSDNVVSAPRYEDPVSGEVREVPVPPAVGELKLFLWDNPTVEAWNAIFIEGVHEESGKSKNWLQDLILSAKNFPGSPVEAMITEIALANGSSVPAKEAAIPAKSTEQAQAEQAPASEASADPLADLAGDDDIPF